MIDGATKQTLNEVQIRSFIFETAAETGCRLAEVLGLVWENVSFTEQTIAFTHQLDRQGKRVPLKTRRSTRVLEITSELIGKLREHRVATARSGDHDLLFVTRTGSGHDHRNIGGRVLARAVERATWDRSRIATAIPCRPHRPSTICAMLMRAP